MPDTSVTYETHCNGAIFDSPDVTSAAQGIANIVREAIGYPSGQPFDIRLYRISAPGNTREKLAEVRLQTKVRNGNS